jgi:hypothetical protein
LVAPCAGRLTRRQAHVVQFCSDLSLEGRQIPTHIVQGVPMATSENNKHKEYARFAAHCLDMVTTVRDQKSSSIQREMAIEWMRLADAMLPHAKKLDRDP